MGKAKFTHEKCGAIGTLPVSGKKVFCHRSCGHSNPLCYDVNEDIEFKPELKKK